MDTLPPHSLARSFERHLRAANRSDATVASYIQSVHQAEAYLTAHGRTLLDARRADLEAFLTDLLRPTPHHPRSHVRMKRTLRENAGALGHPQVRLMPLLGTGWAPL